MRWFRDTGLGIKLTLILLIFLGILLVSLIALLVYNTQRLTHQVANERAHQEVTTLISRLNEFQSGIQSDIGFLVADITFFQAVGRRSQADLDAIIGRTNLSSAVFDVDIVDGDGNTLVNTLGDADSDNSELLTQARASAIQSAITVEESQSQVQVNIAAISPVLSVTRNFLGAIRIQRQLDNALLQDITSQRNDVFVGLVYNNQILARNTVVNPAIDNHALVSDISIDTAAVTQAENGEIVIVDELAFSRDIPYKVAYAPLTLDGSTSPVTLMVLIELANLNSFQTQTLINTIVIFVVLTLLTVLLIYITLSQLAINPIASLQTIAQKIVEGNYDQRIPVAGKDEVGELAATFNVMINTIQEREDSLQEARVEAERANQVKSAFLASMSHELRTPLNAIINFSGFVADGDLGPVNQQQEEILVNVVHSAKHLLNLINDVLDMSKIEAGSLQLFVVDNVNLNEIVTSVLPTAKTLLGDKPVELHLNLDTNIPPISGDKQRITQVLLNLISNACKFTETGSITLSTEKQADHILISVADTGAGIAAEDIESVFKAFVQTEKGVRQGGGTGLGLPISKNLIEAHNGKLWVKSQLGEGSVFYVTLPLQLNAIAV
jgi:signal transduction histidine kinase